MKFIIATIAVATLMLGAAGSAQANGLQSDYCGSQEYYGATPTNNGYPHLHCNKRWINYSAGGGKQSKRIVDKQGLDTTAAKKYCSDTATPIRLREKIAEICDDYGYAKACGCNL
ncbi:MAG: hypothetical protein KTR23_14675 [Rhodospirillales bacterium]|nr:hypothetical protein [Rhodospirillales bacterium]